MAAGGERRAGRCDLNYHKQRRQAYVSRKISYSFRLTCVLSSAPSLSPVGLDIARARIAQEYIYIYII